MLHEKLFADVDDECGSRFHATQSLRELGIVE